MFVRLAKIAITTAQRPSGGEAYQEGRSIVPKENDLEGVQDQGGKHGGQAGMPKATPRPRPDEDVQKGANPQGDRDQKGVKKVPEGKRTNSRL